MTAIFSATIVLSTGAAGDSRSIIFPHNLALPTASFLRVTSRVVRFSEESNTELSSFIFIFGDVGELICDGTADGYR